MLESLAVNNSYRQLVDDVDRLTSALAARYARHLQCRAGCSGCCHHHLSVFRVEADTMRDAIDSLLPTTRVIVETQARNVLESEARGEDVSCPLLVDEKCSIYHNRPIICRTQGLPLLLKADDGVAEVDWCPLNFTDTGAELDLDEDHLVPLEKINLELAIVNLTYSRDSDVPNEASGQRFSVAQIILDAPRSTYKDSDNETSK